MPSSDQPVETFDQWCLVELMGHRRVYGHVTEAKIAGAELLRVDVFSGDDLAPTATQYYSPSALYALTPVGEEACRRGTAQVAPPPTLCLPGTRSPGGWMDDDEGRCPYCDGALYFDGLYEGERRCRLCGYTDTDVDRELATELPV